jgi:glycerate kinase
MEVLIAPDSFKGNVSAPEVCDAIAEGILQADAGAAARKVPLADGGEGTARAITSAPGRRFVSACRREELDPMKTTSYGTGQLIVTPLDSGAWELIIVIGGSATNDDGIGMLSTLGFSL